MFSLFPESEAPAFLARSKMYCKSHRLILGSKRKSRAAFEIVAKHLLAVLLILHIIICMIFEWDEEKNFNNIEKHHVSFETAQRAFLDRNRILLEGEKHSGKEKRFFCIGNDGNGIVTVRFTIRGQSIRIIGAGYWREGRNEYEQRKSNLR